MQAYRVKGKVDETGQLIITEPIELRPGEVEIILLQPPIDSERKCESEESDDKHPRRGSLIQTFQGLFEKAPPIAADVDVDLAKWEYLKEKHNL